MMLRLTYRSGTGLNDWSQSAILGDRGVAARNFADLVAIRMIGTVLPFSERESLVRAAARNGINRFEANLLIAAVQHQMKLGLQRQRKDGLLLSISIWARSFVLTSYRRIIARSRDLRQLARDWTPPAMIAKLHWILAVIQHQWELTRQWLMAKGPRFLFTPSVTVLPETKTRNSPVMRDRPGVVRRREAQREPAKMRISSAVATFVAVQAGIIAAVWYLFAY